MKTAILITSNNPERLQTLFLPSLRHLADMEKDLVICLNLQPPFTEESVNQVVETVKRFGYGDVRQRFASYDTSVTVDLLRMRDDAASLCRECDLYISVDDDITWNENIRHVLPYAINMFAEDDKLGCVELGKKNYETGQIIVSDRYSQYWTNRGQIIRNIYPHIVPTELALLSGGREDVLMILTRIKSGYKSKLLQSTCGTHFENKPKNQRGDEVYGFGKEQEGSVIEYLRSQQDYFEQYFKIIPVEKKYIKLYHPL